MSEESNAKPVLDEDGNDTDTIIEEKDHTSESTGPKGSYQSVPGTNKTITPEGKVMTKQSVPEIRVPDPCAVAGGGGGLSLSIGDVSLPNINIPSPLVDIDVTEPLLNLDIPEPLMNINIPESLVDINIPEPLVDIDVNEPLLNIEIPEPLLNINIPQPLVDIDITEPLMDIDIPQPLVDIVGPLVEVPEIPPWPEIPDNLVNIVGPLVELPEEELIRIVGPLVELPEIPENLVNIVGPMVELPEWPEEGLVNVGDITMPEIVGINVPLDEIPEPVQYGIAGGAILLGLGMLLFGIGKTAGAVSGFTKAIKS